MAKKGKANVASAAGAKNKPDLLDMDVVSEPQFDVGPENRSYLVTDIPPAVTAGRALGKSDWPILAFLCLACFYIRMGHLSQPDSVVFDEVHFGKFAKKYVVGSFFLDVHPPLAKMLFAAVSSIGGFTGNFDFEKIGDQFPSDVPYFLMRAFPALLGSATVLLCYLTLRSSGVRPTVAFLTALCLLLENSFITISRYILLDAPLIFFIAAAIYAYKKFETQQPFTLGWFRSLLSCSISLGLALSSKAVGLFTVVWVGIMCALQMWLYIGDLKKKTCFVVKNAFFRASFLLLIPLALYMTMFYIHFTLLTKDSPDSSFFSSAFRVGLQGSTIPAETDAPIGYGSVVTLQHMKTKGGYLHSHQHFYPEGSKQQQVTLYPHLDANNEWVIEPYNFTAPEYFVPITHDTKIRLKHRVTGRRLHSHDEKAPVSDRDWQKEVTCYGHDEFGGDANDDWIVEVVKHKTPKNAQGEIRAIETVFRLRHAMTGMYLFSSEVKLPDWGFNQQEVTLASQGARAYTHWYIESNKNPYLNVTDRVSYPKLTFLQKFVESHKVMWTVNLGLTQHHNWQSLPHEWPLLMRGINYWTKNHTQIYLLGNPVVWWSATACTLGFSLYVVLSILKWQTGRQIVTNKAVFNYNFQMFSYFVGWAVHYFPFFIMGRQLFLHHYFPAQYFAILGLGHFFELIVGSCSKYRKQAFTAITVFTALSYYAYTQYAPLVDGSQWTKSQCLSSKIVNAWDYNCDLFFEDLSEYRSFKPEQFLATETIAAAETNVIAEPASSVQHVEQQEQQQAPPPSQDEPLEAAPPAESHGGEIHFDNDGNVIVPEVIPLGEMYDEATIEGDAEVNAKAEVAPAEAGASPQQANEPVVQNDKVDAAAEPVETVVEAEVAVETIVEAEVAPEPVAEAEVVDVVVEDVLVDAVVVEDFVVKDAPASSIDLRIEEQ